MNNTNSILNDETLDKVAGGFSFASFFGIPSAPRAPSARTVTNFVVSHNPVLAVGRALKFW